MIFGKIHKGKKQIITDQDITDIAEEVGIANELKQIEQDDKIYYLIAWHLIYDDIICKNKTIH
jgi:hypothetical protein